MSTREYIVNIDLSKIKKVYQREKMKLEDELNLVKKLENEKDEKTKEALIKKAFGIGKNEEIDTIFISHIPNNSIEEALIQLFEEQFGKVKNFYWPNDKQTGFKKSFALLQFNDIGSSRQAVIYGIIGYDIPYNSEDENLNNFELKQSKKSSMLKIKYGDENKYIPNFNYLSSSKNDKSKK